MKKLLLIAVATFAIVGVGRAVDLSSVPCPPGGTPDNRDDEYMLDDGVGENSVGLTSGGTIIWLNQFQVIAGFERIVDVGVAWGQVPAGRSAEVLIFDDPNDDGNPQDLTPADLLWSAPVTTEGGDSDTFFQYPAPNVFVGNEGDVFFVGVCCSQPAGEYPARIDQTFSMGQSWVGGDDALGFTCADPNAGSLGMLNLIDGYGLPGNWMVRASGCVIVPGSPGACCLPDGSCVYTYAVNCGDWLHGMWHGCIPCESVDCPDPEACCFLDGSCQMLADFACVQQGGQSQGPGSQCDPNPCAGVPVDRTDWGRVKLLFR
jgi:hypothetical protein